MSTTTTFKLKRALALSSAIDRLSELTTAVSSADTQETELPLTTAASPADPRETETLSTTTPCETELSTELSLDFPTESEPPAKRRRVQFTSISYTREYVPDPSYWKPAAGGEVSDDATAPQPEVADEVAPVVVQPDTIFITKKIDGPATDVKVTNEMVLFILKNRKISRSQIGDFIRKAKVAECKAKKLALQRQMPNLVHPDFDVTFQLPAPPSSPSGDDKEFAALLASREVFSVAPEEDPDVSIEEVDELRVQVNGRIKVLLGAIEATGKACMLPSTNRLNAANLPMLRFLDLATGTRATGTTLPLTQPQ
jgi:hypothetical protein